MLPLVRPYRISFLRFLDARVGKGHYLLALTADHGICPLVETSVAKGRKTGKDGTEDVRRVDPAALRATR